MTTNEQAKAETASTKRAIGSRLLPEGSAGAVTEWYPTRWPRVGGTRVLQLPDDAFTQGRFLSAYQPGKLVFTYAAGCGEDHRMTSATGLLGLARRLRMSVHKVSVTAQVDPRSRMRELNADHYGAIAAGPDGLCSDLGYDNWMLQHILPPSAPLRGSPVFLAERALAIRLPNDLSVREFDKRLHHWMSNAALNPWLRSEAGKAHCVMLSIDPAQLIRKTGYGFGEHMRISDAEEFYFFRPKSRDAERLLRITELIVYNHVVNPRHVATRSWKSRGQGYGQLIPSVP